MKVATMSSRRLAGMALLLSLGWGLLVIAIARILGLLAGDTAWAEPVVRCLFWPLQLASSLIRLLIDSSGEIRHGERLSSDLQGVPLGLAMGATIALYLAMVASVFWGVLVWLRGHAIRRLRAAEAPSAPGCS